MLNVLKEAPSSLDIPGAVKTSDLVFDLFKGATYQFQESRGLDEHVAQLLALPIVKNVWPKELIPAPDDKINWIASLEQASNHLVRRADRNDTYSTHVQTQVDKLRAKGITGKGVKIAVIDTEVCAIVPLDTISSTNMKSDRLYPPSPRRLFWP